MSSVRKGSVQPLVSRLNGRGKVTTIIGTRVALGKRLPPFNGANTADKRKQMQHRGRGGVESGDKTEIKKEYVLHRKKKNRWKWSCANIDSQCALILKQQKQNKNKWSMTYVLFKLQHTNISNIADKLFLINCRKGGVSKFLLHLGWFLEQTYWKTILLVI